MDLKRILVAVDTLQGRDAAFERAVAIARSSGAELYLLHAVPLDRRFSAGGSERLQRVADLRTFAEDAGVRVHAIEQHGDPAAVIDLHARSRAADLIVLGGGPRRGGRREAPVAEQVIRRTEVPTLVVGGDGPVTSAYGHVLAALDLSPASADVLDAAVAFTSDEAARLTVLHTVQALEADDAVISPGRWMVPEYRSHVLDGARRDLADLVSAVPASLDTRLVVSGGSAAPAILDQAADTKADLVVVGRSRGFKILGSTARRLLRKSDRSLLVIPGGSPARRIEQPLAA
jgi:nucleotide-binding universal stress UspA family protein